MKKRLFIISSVLVILIIAGTVIFFFLRKEPVYIAVAAPLSGLYKNGGDAMLKGIHLYADEVNREGGIGGRKIKLLVFNDRGRPESAAKIASEIATDMKIVLTLGHFTSQTSFVAGRIYRKNGIPAITASATENSVTLENDWYFRVVPNNAAQGRFLVEYIRQALNKEAASIIVTRNAYGISLAQHFENEAQSADLTIKKKWEIDFEGSQAGQDLKRMAAELRGMSEPGAIFIAAFGDEGAKIISLLKFSGTNYSIIGPDSFASESFLSAFDKYPLERSRPGYFTDGIYAISPFQADIANETGQAFRQKFLREYNTEPSWISACYFDAARVAVEAIRMSEIQGEGRRRRDRREVREFLAGMHTHEASVRGATGDIYFDKNGDVRAPFLPVVVYNRQKRFPAFSQYQVSAHEMADSSLKKVLDGKSILAGDVLMDRTDVVYTGIDVNEVSALNARTSSYTADFYLWFRYEGDMDVTNVRFADAVNPVKLGTPVVHKKMGSVTVQSYRVKADFKGNFDFHTYPFDEQIVGIRFRHESLTRDKLFYISDTLGMYGSGNKNIKLDAVTGWVIKDASFYQNIVSTASSLGVPDAFDDQNVISYSQFNAEIRIKRSGVDAVLRYFLPVMVMLLGLYLIFYMPYERYGIGIGMLVSVLTANAFCHQNLLAEISSEYATLAEYAIFSVYLLTLVCTVIFSGLFTLIRQGNTEKVKQILRIGKILYAFMLLGVGSGIGYLYHIHSSV